MKKVKGMICLVLVMALIPMISKAQEPVAALEFPNAAKALELAQKYSKALQAGDVATMDAQFAPNAMIYGLGGGLDSLNKAEHKEYYMNSTSQYTHSLSSELYLPVKVTNNWNEGEWVLSWGNNTLKDKKTGKTMVVPYHTASLIVNGKIVSMRYWYDMLNIIQAQGYEVKPPSK